MKDVRSLNTEPIQSNQKDRWIDLLFFFLLLFLSSAVTLWLFAHQAVGSESSYHSDMKAYILNMQGLDSGYSFPYPILFKVGAFFHLFLAPEISMALATMVLNSMGMVALKVLFQRTSYENLCKAFDTHPFLKKYHFLAGMLISVLSVSLFFVSMIFLPGGRLLPGLRFKYLGVFTANPFHNATYMAARPFAIPAFGFFAKLLDEYEEGKPKEKLWDYLWFSLSLLLATMAKPSFTICLVGTAGLIMVFRLIRSGFRNFLPTVILGCCFLPTFADLLYQFQGVFVPSEGETGGVGFCLGEVWRLYCTNFPAAIALAIGFPLTVLLFHFKELKKDTFYRFSWQLYVMSFAMAFLLYEKGFRKPDFNFSWGYMCGIFFAFVGAIYMLLKDCGAEEQEGNLRKKRRSVRLVIIGIQWLAFLAHLVCGLYYFYGILRGNMYY